MKKALSLLIALIVGLIGGLIISIGVIVARAQFMRVYVEYVGDAMGWAALVIGGAVVAAIVATLLDWCRTRRAALIMLASAALASALGTALGALFLDATEGVWAGGVMGCAFGVIVGGVTGLAHACSRPSEP